MSVQITFEVDGGNGLVAEGSSVWEAAKRLGVHLPADCKGRGQCDACAVLIVQGAERLSPVNECERKMLGQDRLGAGKRLACQTTLTTSGEVMVRPAPIVASAEKNKDAKKLFRELSLSQQIGALIELEAITVTEAMNTLRGKSIALVDRFLNLKPKKLAESQAHRDGAKGTL